MKLKGNSVRVGKPVGQELWHIKEAPGWKVIHKCATLREAGRWLMEQNANLSKVDVLTPGPWKSLLDHLEREGGLYDREERCPAAASHYPGEGMVHHARGLYPAWCARKKGHDGKHSDGKNCWPQQVIDPDEQQAAERLQAGAL